MTMSLVLFDNTRLFDYESYFPGYGDIGPYWEPLSSSQEQTYDDTNYSIYDYREADDDDDNYYYYSNRSWNTSDATGRDGNGFFKGCGNWLGDYEFFFGGNLEESEAYSVIGCQDYGVCDSGYNSYTQQDHKHSEDQWPRYDNLSSEGNITEDYGEANHDFPCNSRWDETLLYERIFGDSTHDMDAE